MANRVEGLVGARVARGMWILTFHSACARILRREHNQLGVPSHFSIYDEGDTERVISLVLKSMDIDPKRYPPRAVAALIGRAKDELVWPQQYAEHAALVIDHNSRYTLTLLSLANALIEHNVQRKPKSLWTDSDTGDLAVRFRAENEHE